MDKEQTAQTLTALQSSDTLHEEGENLVKSVTQRLEEIIKDAPVFAVLDSIAIFIFICLSGYTSVQLMKSKKSDTGLRSFCLIFVIGIFWFASGFFIMYRVLHFKRDNFDPRDFTWLVFFSGTLGCVISLIIHWIIQSGAWIKTRIFSCFKEKKEIEKLRTEEEKLVAEKKRLQKIYQDKHSQVKTARQESERVYCDLRSAIIEAMQGDSIPLVDKLDELLRLKKSIYVLKQEEMEADKALDKCKNELSACILKLRSKGILEVNNEQ